MTEAAHKTSFLRPVPDESGEEASHLDLQAHRQGDEEFRRLIESTRASIKAAQADLEEDQRQLDQVMAEVNQYMAQRETLRANTLKLAGLVEDLLEKQASDRREAEQQ